MNTNTWTFESSSSSATYTVKKAADGSLSCNCKGWTIKKGDKPRSCKHTAHVAALSAMPDYGLDDVSAGRGPQKATAADVRRHDPKPIKPMLACTMDSADITNWNEWAIEEKFDGHRAIVMVATGVVTAWSRSGKARALPPQVEKLFSRMPSGIYDGELMGKENGTFADVRRLESQDTAYFVVFDIINYMGDNLTGSTYDARRDRLDRIFGGPGRDAVRLAESVDLTCEADVVKFVSSIWERGGEGAILKRRAARYQPGKRSPDFVKVKKGGTCVAVVTGFKPGERGPFSVVCVRTVEHGIETTVKNESKLGAPSAAWVGRALRIEFTEVRDGAVVNPPSDRWEDK